MFEIPIFVNDGKHEMPDDDILYIVCKEGTYLKKNLGIMESITPVKNISVLQGIEMMATMHIKSIPGTLFSQVMAFFRQVFLEHRSEAIVLLFYNEEKKVYKVVPPHQKVSGAGVDYNRAMTIDGYTMIGDIHSHANFSAFHSGIDDKDEQSFDGLHITIGNNGDAEVSISTSIVSNGQRFIADTADYVNGISLTKDVDEEVEKPFSTVYIWDKDQKKLVPKETQKTYTVRRYDKRYVSSVSQKYQRCPAEWMKLVEKQAWGGYAAGGYYGGQPWRAQSWRNWNTTHYDPNAWKNRNFKTHPASKPPLVPAATKPITFPPHAQTGPYEEVLDENGFNPCEACPFQAHKIDWVLEQITNAELNSDDGSEAGQFVDDKGNPVDWYECNKCDATFYTSDEMAVCPNCNVDDHLILLDLDDIQGDERISPSDDVDWYRCDECNEIFDTVYLEPECPRCKNEKTLVKLSLQQKPIVSDPIPESYNYKCKECATETSVLNHGQCPFCGGDVMDLIDQQALEAAREEDETLEKLPVPDQDSVPLASRKKRRGPGVFAKMFGKDRDKS